MTLESLRSGDPRQVGPYTLVGRLGEGGMGVVYLGQGPDGVRVAVKVIHARMDAQPDFRRRFAREVAAAQRVARFCTAPVLDADVTGEVAYLVTEYVEGPSLGAAVKESGPLKGSALDGLAAAMAMALRAIHGAGVVHRDLKPSNVLLSQVGPKVIDFGIAQLMDAEVSSAIVGTPSYMSPEQVSGVTVGPASDIFSWGSTVAFAASGVPPFGTGPVPNVLVRVVNEQPELSGLSGPLRELVAAAMSKNPTHRPTAQDLLDRLSADASGGAISIPGLPGASGPPNPPGTGSIPPDTAPATGPSGASIPPGVGGASGPQSAGGASPMTGPSGAGGMGGRPRPPLHEGAPTGSGEVTEPTGRRRWVAAGSAVAVAVAALATTLVVRGLSGDTSQTPTGTAATGTTPGAATSTKNTAASSATGTATNGATSSATTTPANTNAEPGNPLRAAGSVGFYSPKEPGARDQAEAWRKDRPEDAKLMELLAAVPHAIRLAQPEVRPKVEESIAAAAQAGAVPVFLVSNLPGGDCSKPGPGEMERYQQWIEGIARTIGPAKAVVILEPDSLARVPGIKGCDPGGSPDERYRALRDAVTTLKSNPSTAVYLDGSQVYWPGAEVMAERLIEAGIDKADGFFLNVTGFHATDKSVEYGKELSACIAARVKKGGGGCPKDVDVDPADMPHFVVDTSRNGQGAWVPDKHYKDPQTWCNPPGRGVGPRPTTETGEELVDAYLWIARPGVSGGRCRRGTDGEKDPERGVVSPPAGQWWDVLGLEMAKNANPPLR
ncbi:glycoside hydrolase family 6 protein [Nonomuraea fastidiosa]|jgi:hypothetical protein|uniref:glycoside hydrolase family 6 protein n=1 Tax=Nonomuraea TaxID=83681 RepID=UPI00324EA24B